MTSPSCFSREGLGEPRALARTPGTRHRPSQEGAVGSQGSSRSAGTDSSGEALEACRPCQLL